MKPCEFEPQVIAAAKTGKPTGLIFEHLAECETCQEAYAVGSALNRLAETTQAEIPPMVAADLLWLKAELDEKPQSRINLHLISAAVIVLALGLGQVLFRLLWSGSAPAPSLRLPITSSPFPLDAGCIVVAVAVALVIILPSVNFSRPLHKRRSTLYSV